MEAGKDTTNKRFERIDVARIIMMSRSIHRVDVSLRFKKEFNGLPRRIQELVRKKDALFRTNAFHPSLDTHQLSGKLHGDWSYSVNKQYRVHFYFIDDHSVMYVSIGTHEIYK